MKSFFKRDSIWLGILIGIILPVLTYFLIYLILNIVGGEHQTFRKSTIYLLSIFINLAPFRYYIVKLKFDKTGRGILLDTFVMAIIYFIFYLDLGE